MLTLISGSEVFTARKTGRPRIEDRSVQGNNAYDRGMLLTELTQRFDEVTRKMRGRLR